MRTYLVRLERLKQKIALSDFVQKEIEQKVVALKPGSGKSEIAKFLVHVHEDEKRDSSNALQNKLFAAITQSPDLNDTHITVSVSRKLLTVAGQKFPRLYEAVVTVFV